MHSTDHEALVTKLKNPDELKVYMAECDGYRVGPTARALGAFLVGAGNMVYGRRPSYEKFKAVEVIARIPYQSWEAVAYTYLTAYYGDEMHAIRLSRILPFARHAQDNETMHVVVVSQLVQKYHRNKFFRHTLIPILFSFLYYWLIWIVSFFDKGVAFELNYLFEQHAYEQYTEFLAAEGERMKGQPLDSPFLKFYGREATNEYDLFESIRLDEVIHRNASVEMIRDLDHKHLA